MTSPLLAIAGAAAVAAAVSKIIRPTGTRPLRELYDAAVSRQAASTSLRHLDVELRDLAALRGALTVMRRQSEELFTAASAAVAAGRAADGDRIAGQAEEIVAMAELTRDECFARLAGIDAQLARTAGR